MPWSASRKYAGPDHPWAHFSKHSMSSVLSIHQDSHINNESSVSAATQNFWKEQNLTNFSTKLNWSTLHSVTGYEVTRLSTPSPVCKHDHVWDKRKHWHGTQPLPQSRLGALTYGKICRPIILAGCWAECIYFAFEQNAVILTIFNPSFVHPSGDAVVRRPLPRFAFLQLLLQVSLLMCTSKGRQQFILSASTDRTWEYEQAFKVSHSQLRHNQQLLWQHNTATPVSAATKV